jgi:glutathione S-transferase
MLPSKLYYHPLSRAADVVWMLEEVGVPYEKVFVDIKHGGQKTEEFRKLNPMGKLPVLVDGQTLVTERAAIGLYLADRYAAGVLAPALDAPERGTYLRWSLFSPSVIEPGAIAHAAGWDFRPGNAGWGTWDSVLDSLRSAVSHGDYLLGERFSMADVIFGGTLRYMMMFKMIEPLPELTEYVARLDQRPARQRSDAINAQERERVQASEQNQQ